MAPLGRLVFPFTDTEMRLYYMIQTEFSCGTGVAVDRLGDWLAAQLTTRLSLFWCFVSLVMEAGCQVSL